MRKEDHYWLNCASPSTNIDKCHNDLIYEDKVISTNHLTHNITEYVASPRGRICTINHLSAQLVGYCTSIHFTLLVAQQQCSGSVLKYLICNKNLINRLL